MNDIRIPHRLLTLVLVVAVGLASVAFALAPWGDPTDSPPGGSAWTWPWNRS